MIDGFTLELSVELFIEEYLLLPRLLVQGLTAGAVKE